ncbi:hypothetical protein A616_16570 [Brevibacillus brevis X23]|nr:hypothetical protein A616_16570 [Brevibacillus brevis X23]
MTNQVAFLPVATNEETQKIVKDMLQFISEHKLAFDKSLSQSDVPFIANGSGNENMFQLQWWGYQIYLDYNNTNILIDAIKKGTPIGEIASILISVIPGVGPILSVLLGVCTILVGSIYLEAIEGCNKAGRGIIINVVLAGFTFISEQ